LDRTECKTQSESGVKEFLREKKRKKKERKILLSFLIY
jgi:hypothetical protein